MLNEIIKEDFNGAITLELLNSKKSIDIPLQPAVLEDLNYQLQMIGRERETTRCKCGRRHRNTD